jgi:hypothetical protein
VRGVNKPSKIRKQTVDLHPAARPSRIRRAPPQSDNALTRKLGRIDWASREWEIRFGIAGIIFFALAINAAVIDLGEMLGH